MAVLFITMAGFYGVWLSYTLNVTRGKHRKPRGIEGGRSAVGRRGLHRARVKTEWRLWPVEHGDGKLGWGWRQWETTA
jgi:hypothetical protein